MFRRLSFTLLSLMLLTSIGLYSFMEYKVSGMEKEIALSDNGDIGKIETATALRGFAYLENEKEDVSFLKEEIKRIELEKKQKEEAERKAKEEAERKAKEEAQRKARAEAQRKAKLEADKKAQQSGNSQTTSSNSSYSDSDLEALAKIIHAEARGEPYQGKVAVGAVVMNRVKSSSFPNSIHGVIHQPKQFQPVSNGAYQRAKPTEADYKAAREALNGVDPTGGATFFYAPSIATTSWHETLTHTTTIGSHRFFKK